MVLKCRLNDSRLTNGGIISSVLMIELLLLLVGGFALLNHYNVQNHPNAFDSPEAQKAKSVRGPWNQ